MYGFKLCWVDKKKEHETANMHQGKDGRKATSVEWLYKNPTSFVMCVRVILLLDAKSISVTLCITNLSTIQISN